VTSSRTVNPDTDVLTPCRTNPAARLPNAIVFPPAVIWVSGSAPTVLGSPYADASRTTWKSRAGSTSSVNAVPLASIVHVRASASLLIAAEPARTTLSAFAPNPHSATTATIRPKGDAARN
jgi:hypothetical protein